LEAAPVYPDHPGVQCNKLAPHAVPAHRLEKETQMKHSLTAASRPASLFDLMAESLGAPAPADMAAERSKALKPTILERLERALWRARQREIERRLEGAVDATDLEEKLRRLERRHFHRYY
jgi:hypothetical protein